MAKIAILFVLVALFAVCFAARVPREDAKPDAKPEFKLPETFTEFQTQINKAIEDSKIEETLRKTFSEENLKALRDIAEKFGEQGKKLVEDANASLRKLGEKP